jgi:hypothetical protein
LRPIELEAKGQHPQAPHRNWPWSSGLVERLDRSNVRYSRKEVEAFEEKRQT